jgi:hypothetical protein
MLENIKQEDTQMHRALLYHIQVIPERDILIGAIYQGLCPCTGIVIQSYGLFPCNSLKIIPGPLFISRPVFTESGDNNGFTCIVIVPFEIFGANVLNSIDGGDMHKDTLLRNMLNNNDKPSNTRNVPLAYHLTFPNEKGPGKLPEPYLSTTVVISMKINYLY